MDAAVETPQQGIFVPRMQAVPPDAPAIRVNNVSPEDAPAQAIYDNDVKLAHQEWVESGRPPLFNRSPRKYYEIPPGAGADGVDYLTKAIKQLNNAARLLPGVRIKIAKPIQQLEDGTHVLIWVAKERNPRPATVAKREAAAPAPPARAPAPQPAQPWSPTFRAPSALPDRPP